MARPPARDRAARSAAVGTRRIRWLVALGIAAALLFTVATLPASLLAGRLTRAGIHAVAWSGSVWSGNASGLAWRGTELGDLRWSVAPLALLKGRAAADLELQRPDGQARGRYSASIGGKRILENGRADLPLEVLAALPLGLPKGWTGRVRAEIAELSIAANWPTTVRGSIDLDDLVAPPPRSFAIGSYRAALPDPEADGDAATITAHVSDKGGPFGVDARFTLSPDRSYVLEGTLDPRGAIPPAVRQSIELLGPVDAAGRRQFSIAGTL
jgi:general secretion pathway protein N